MKQVEIAYNPYRVQTKMSVNGGEPKSGSKIIQYLDKRFQLWVEQIPSLLEEEYNDDEFELTFCGTELDYQDLMAAIGQAEKKGIQFRVKNLPAKEFGDKENSIRKLYSQMKELPFKELQSPALANAFELAFNELLEVNVVATMSAGKSTLINALLGNQLMPSKMGACTATITRIQDDDDSTYKAVVYGKDKSELEYYSDLDYEAMKDLNANENVNEIWINGDIPFVTADEASLVLIDTPGPDNARDPRHGKIALKALEQSSKMLVMFVMNGGTLHNEEQDKFLKRIAESMKVGGKQSKERFLFIINKMDEYDEEQDDIRGETLPDTIKYLEDMGIEEPNIFPVAAKPALFIRRYQNTSNENEKKRLLKWLTPIAEKLIEQEQLHLEQYPHLGHSCQAKIDEELKLAIEENDIYGQALVHSGIRGIEETIRMYVTKYCRPAKIRNLVDCFQKELESAEAFMKTKEEVVSHEGDLKKIEEEIEKLIKKISSREVNEEFKERLRAFDIRLQLQRSLTDLIAEVEKAFTSFFRNCPDELQESEAMNYIERFKNLANHKQSEFQVSVERLLDCDVKEKSNQLLNEYIKKLNTISEEFSGNGLKISLESYVRGELAQFNTDSVLDTAIESRIEEREEKRLEKVTHVRRGWDRFFHPECWFDPHYTTDEIVEYVIKEEIKYISREKLSNAMVAFVRGNMHKERRRVMEYAEKGTQIIKEYFEEQFDKVDGILEEKMTELIEISSSKDKAQEALREASELMRQLEEIGDELNRILEI